MTNKRTWAGLDTCTIRHYLHEHPQGAGFERLKLLQHQFAFTIPAGALLELVEDLYTGEVPWTIWNKRKGTLRELIDPGRPVLPDGKHLVPALRAGPDGIGGHLWIKRHLRSLWKHILDSHSGPSLADPFIGDGEDGNLVTTTLNLAGLAELRKSVSAPFAEQLKRFHPSNPDNAILKRNSADAFAEWFHKVTQDQIGDQDAEYYLTFSHLFAWHARETLANGQNPDKWSIINDAIDVLNATVAGVGGFLISNDGKLHNRLVAAKAKAADRCLSLCGFLELFPPHHGSEHD